MSPSEVKAKRILEVGSLDVNGSLRRIVTAMEPAEYLGVDISEGPGVDRVCNVFDLERTFGRDSFDVVVSTEMVEHIEDWRSAISQLKRVTKPGGSLILTTRSKGFPKHEYPYDFWRFEIDDMQKIFSDMKVDVIEPDLPEQPGVFVKVTKPVDFAENDLGAFELYSMVTRRRTKDLNRLNVVFAKIQDAVTSFANRAANSARYRLGR